MKHLMNLRNGPFVKIKLGSKTVELRLYDDKRRSISIGDTILFTNISTNEHLLAEVTNLRTFTTFEELYANFDKVSMGYAENDVANAKDMLTYYTAEQIATFGVVAIEIKVC